jgi:hypothetical protein
VADGATTAAAAHARVGAREARPYLADLFCFRIVARLAGEADHLALNGVDRWIGGVHLAGPDSPWRWDEGTEGIVSV